MATPLKLGFLASHTGSSMRAIVEAIECGRLNAEAKLVISNNADASALLHAAQCGISTAHISATSEGSPEEADNAIAEAMVRAGVNLIVLSGYLRPVGAVTLARYQGRVLNVHPSLLPKYGGKGMYGKFVHEAVIANREKITGATIHIVDAQYDHGPIVDQAQVRVCKGESVDSLKAKVMAIEPPLFIAALQEIARRKVVVPHFGHVLASIVRYRPIGRGGWPQLTGQLVRTGISWVGGVTGLKNANVVRGNSLSNIAE